MLSRFSGVFYSYIHLASTDRHAFRGSLRCRLNRAPLYYDFIIILQNLFRCLLQALPSSTCSRSAPDCYGCASCIAQQCITLLRVLAINPHAKPHLISNGVVQELVMFNLRRGSPNTRKQVLYYAYM